jgi:hypothetical protein
VSDQAASPTSRAGWEAGLEVALCERCQWRFLAPAGQAQTTCPHCHQQPLTLLPGGLPEMPHPYPPELVLPFRLAGTDLKIAIDQFSRGIPFTPPDLNPRSLQERLAPVCLPEWLVDASVSACWQAEAGFDYQVVSHQEFYSQDAARWQTREVQEDRIRWEKRVGRLDRAYQNISAPALEDAPRLKDSLGAFELAGAQPYRPEHLAGAYVRLPDLPPAEAWKEAVDSFQNTAAEECRQACAAGRLRQFAWKAEFQQINWTLMLMPAYTSYYLDDAGRPQPVLIHGQTGRVTGARRASMQRARGTSLALLLGGIILFLVGLILDGLPGPVFLAGISLLLMLAGIAGVVGSAAAYATAWDFNRKEDLRQAEALRS